MTSPFMTVKDVADFLVVSKCTVYRLVKQGHLERIKINRMVRISKKSFDAYVDSLYTKERDQKNWHNQETRPITGS